MEEEEQQNYLEELEKELLRSKMKFILYWTTLFFHEEHRAVMAYLCHQKLEGVDKVSSQTDSLFWKSKNIDNILVELKNGFLVTI